MKYAVRQGSLASPSDAALIVRQRLPYVYVAREVLRSAGVPCQTFDALPLAAEPYAAALDLVHVACGMLDGYVEYRLNWWDIAAGALIVREAGGAIGGLGGNRWQDGYILACAPGLLIEATALFDSAFAVTRDTSL